MESKPLCTNYLDVTVLVTCMAYILELVRTILVVFFTVKPVGLSGGSPSTLSGVMGGVSAIKSLGFYNISFISRVVNGIFSCAILKNKNIGEIDIISNGSPDT